MTLNDKNKKRLGAYLREVRLGANKSQQDIAIAMRLSSNQHISNIERGKSQASLDYLKKFQKICNTPKNDFVIEIQQLYVDEIREALK